MCGHGGLGREFTFRRLEWDDGIINCLTAIEEKFWNSYVVPGTFPPPDGSRACDEAIRQYFPVSEKAGAITLDGFDGKLQRREEILRSISMLETEQKQIEQEVKLLMKDNERAESGHFYVTWKSVDSTRLDTARIRAERPEVYAEYAKVSSCRRFEVKAIAEKEGEDGKASGQAA